MEKFENKLNKKPAIQFEKIQKEDNVLVYVFPNVGVAIDRSGKNYQKTSRIIIWYLRQEISEGSMDKPEVKREGVEMSKVVEYIKIAAKDSGINEFLIYPYSENGVEEETRKQARMRLFSRYVDVEPDENEFGYIIKI